MMTMKWVSVLCVLLALLSGAVCAEEYSPGYLMQPPKEVMEHLSRSFSSYTLEDYCEVRDTPDGDYGFALLTAGDERLLVGYEEKDGKMSYWLKNHGAVPQGSEEAWFSVSEKGKAYMDARTDKEEISDGLSFGVTRLDDAGESYQMSVTYHWEDGGFKLKNYSKETLEGVYIEDGYLEFWDWGWWRKEGTVKGTVQTDLRYVSFNTLPKKIDEARLELSTAPDLPRGGFYPKEIKFTGGQKYPVYTGPGEEYARSGNGKGMVSTNDWIQVLGSYGDWIMIQYDISAKRYRIGWITKDALPKGAKVTELDLYWGIHQSYAQDVVKACSLTDDPFNSQKAIAKLEKGTPLKELVYDYEGWSYVIVEVDGELMGGFVPAKSISHG